jgi:hypothetical protein
MSIVHYLGTPEGKKQDFSGLTGTTAASPAPVAASPARERTPLQIGPDHHRCGSFAIPERRKTLCHLALTGG